ncbi:MAG: hypothetical protein Q9198_006209, partial [Flavoplaca austrocitrina]
GKGGVKFENGEEGEGEDKREQGIAKRKQSVGDGVEGDEDQRKKVKKEEIDEHAEEKDSKNKSLQDGAPPTSSESLQGATGQVGGIKTEQQDICIAAARGAEVKD